MKQCISDAEELDWESFWQEKLKAKEDRQKDWNKAAPNFGKSARKPYWIWAAEMETSAFHLQREQNL